MGFGELWLVNSDLLTGLPMKVAYPSLNLAQSVMLYAWEMSGLSGASDVQHEHAEESRLGALRSRLESLLPELDTPPEGKLFQWAFERLPLLSDRDIGFVHTMCSNIERALHPRLCIRERARRISPSGIRCEYVHVRSTKTSMFSTIPGGLIRPATGLLRAPIYGNYSWNLPGRKASRQMIGSSPSITRAMTSALPADRVQPNVPWPVLR